MTPEAARMLVDRGSGLFHERRTPVRFTGDDLADDLLNDLERYPHAFVLACVMDRQVKSEKAWLIPRQLADRLGDFSFPFLASLSDSAIREAFLQPSPLHRFPDEMSGNLHLAIRHIAAKYGGSAARIWAGCPSSAEVVLRFLAFRGIGPKIATMATNILVRHFKIPLSDYYSVDVSADIHLRRVFARLALIPQNATVEEIVYTARALHPEFPGLMDFPAWEIGRSWCRPKEPQCHDCYMRPACPTAASRGEGAG